MKYTSVCCTFVTFIQFTELSEWHLLSKPILDKTFCVRPAVTYWWCFSYFVYVYFSVVFLWFKNEFYITVCTKENIFPMHWILISYRMNAELPMLSPSSLFLPDSFHCTFIPTRNNFSKFFSVLFFNIRFKSRWSLKLLDLKWHKLWSA